MIFFPSYFWKYTNVMWLLPILFLNSRSSWPWMLFYLRSGKKQSSGWFIMQQLWNLAHHKSARKKLEIAELQSSLWTSKSSIRSWVIQKHGASSLGSQSLGVLICQTKRMTLSSHPCGPGNPGRSVQQDAKYLWVFLLSQKINKSL